MSDTKISALPAASAALGTQELPINEAGASKKLTVAQIQALIVAGLAADRGTAFPTGAALTAFGNRPFWRTDLGESFYYNGTRWLSCVPYRDSLVTAQTPMTSLTANASIGRWTPWADDCDLWMVAVYASLDVTGTNSGSAFWRLAVMKYQSDFATSIVMGTVDTGTNAPSAVFKYKIALGAAYTPGTYPIVQVEATKVGSPGSLATPVVFMSYRKIAT